MARSHTYATDPNPSSAPRLSALINFSDGTGANPSGIVPAIAADPADFMAKGDTSPATAAYSMDNLITLGLRRIVFNRPFGDWNAAGAINNCPGHYPHNYPVAESAGVAHAVTPRNQVQSETAFGNTNYTAALKAAFDTAGRLGTVYGCDCYLGPVEASVATDDTTLDTYSEFIRYMGMGSIYDIQAALSHTNTAPPQFMGANCLGYWEANKLSYSDAGTTLAVDNDPVRQWNSLKGSLTWSQATADNRPLLKTGLTNGGKTFSALLFDGTNDVMSLSARQTMGAAYTVVAVVKLPTTDGVLFSNSDAGNPRLMLRFNNAAAGTLSDYDGTTVNLSNVTQFTGDTWAVIRYRYDGTNCRMFVNGTEVSGYIIGPGSTANQLIDSMGNAAYAGIVYFSGHVAAAGIMNANCTDNQIALIEAYWAAKYGITVAGSPVLPQKAFKDRLFAGYALKNYREDFNYRTITELSDWDTNSSGILTIYSYLAAALADPTNFYTKASIGSGQRARVMILNDGASVATRISRMYQTLALGYDVDLDFGGFSTGDITYAVTQHKILTAQPGIPGTPYSLPEPLLRLG